MISDERPVSQPFMGAGFGVDSFYVATSAFDLDMGYMLEVMLDAHTPDGALPVMGDEFEIYRGSRMIQERLAVQDISANAQEGEDPDYTVNNSAIATLITQLPGYDISGDASEDGIIRLRDRSGPIAASIHCMYLIAPSQAWVNKWRTIVPNVYAVGLNTEKGLVHPQAVLQSGNSNALRYGGLTAANAAMIRKSM